ncbi:tyrosine-type recombinase/integrase [Bradyrhizobium diazoefficiens]
MLYIAERVRLVATGTVMGAFITLCHLSRSRVLAEDVELGAMISPAFFAEMRGFNDLAPERLHHVRHWYEWCAMQGLPQFSRETSALLSDLTIGGGEKGRAVRTRDPERGAFDDIEYGGLVTKLRARGEEVLSLFERTLLWLEMAFGRNPFAYALMREEDYRPMKERGTDRVYHRFQIPQIKQGYTYLRSGFDQKLLNQELGPMVASLIAENTAKRERNGWPEGCAFPLFPRRKPQSRLWGGSLHDYAMHLTSSEIRIAVRTAVDKLELTSHRTGEPLDAFPRRFRYTFGTRMAENGASPAQAAIALGHADTQHVRVYYETRSSQVERLDAALAVTLGPIADAFMGRIVDDAADAVNGGDPTKRIPWFRRKFGEKPQRGDDLGVCGSGPCGLFAPVSCYTCAKFQPWRNGPHREVLDWLVAERERKRKEGLDPQLFKIHDMTILAVGKVVAACEGDRD